MSFEDQDYQAGEPARVSGHFGLLGVFWRRKWFVLLGLVLGAGLGYLYYVRLAPAYASSARVLVVRKRPEVVPLSSNTPVYSYYEDYLGTHQALIKSPIIGERAAKKLQGKNLPSLAGYTDPTSAIVGSVTTNRETTTAGDTSILGLTCKGASAEDCRTILQAVIEGYEDYLLEHYQDLGKKTLDLIKEARDVLKKDLAQAQAAYQKFRVETPLMWKGKDGVNVHQERLGNIETAKSTLLVRRAEAQSRLAAVKKALKEGRSREVVFAVVSRTGLKSAGDVPGLNDPIVSLEQEEEMLLGQWGEEHPQVKSVRKRLELARRFGKRHEQAKVKALQSKDSNIDPLDLHIEILQQELAEQAEQEQTLNELYKQEQAEARKLTQYEVENERLSGEDARTQQLYEGVIKRLQEVDLIKDMGGYQAQVISPPTAGGKVEPKPLPIFMVACFAGLLVGLGLAYLAELADKSFRNAEEIRGRLGLPVVAHIPYVRVSRDAKRAAETAGSGLDPILWTHYRPKSQESEAYRSVRTALYFSTRGEHHKVIQITSPNVGDGKTTLAANLAVCIAQSGKRTLLIDADFRKSRLHKIFGVPRIVGLATVIQGEAELNDAIQTSAVTGLDILPCGPTPPNPAELLTSPRFEELLNVIREKYDFVIIDTPPLLVVTDACVVAPRVDGVFLTIRISKQGRPQAERAKEVLDTLQANVLGVVVNAIEPSGKGYGGYGYGRYSYGYGYGYTYGDREADSYYSDRLIEGEAAVVGKELPTSAQADGAARKAASED